MLSPSPPTPSPALPAGLAGAEPAPRGVHRHPPATPEFVERVRELFAYDPETGELRYRVDIWFGRHRDMLRVRAGDIAGRVEETRGYRRVFVDGRWYRAHRIAFLIVEGRWPADQIDHIDGVKTNNAWSNLREVDNRTNTENQRRARCDNQCGLLGVSRNGKRWRAAIKLAGQLHHLGTYDTAKAAHQVYLEAKRELHAGCTI